jgi:AcrR family transcriptional regulator
MARSDLKNTDLEAKNCCINCNVEDRLLDAAEKLFCENGFNGTSVRDLTTEANCNVAAVNYHFGSKEQLYRAMFNRHLKWVLGFHKQNIKEVMNSENPTVEKLVESLAGYTFRHNHSENSKIPMLKLVIRECLNPKFEKDITGMEIVKEFLTEIQKALMILFPKLKFKKAMLCVFSLEGMIIHPLLFGDIYHEFVDELSIDQLIEHIVQFASDAIRQAVKLYE